MVFESSNRMAIITRTTTHTTGSRITTSTVPVWLIKLVTVILSCIVLLFLYMMDQGAKGYYSRTFILIGITCGALLGWSLGSVLQQVLTMRHVEMVINGILTALSIICAVLCLAYIFETNDSSNSNRFKMMLGTAVCFVIQSIICILMLSWACYGNVVIVQRV